MSGIAIHLLQSTLFASVAAALAFALRQAPARARYWIWLGASVKFLLLFSLLISIGGSLAWRPMPGAQALAAYDAVDPPVEGIRMAIAAAP